MICVQGKRPAQQAQPVEVVPQDRILHPQRHVPGRTHGLDLHRGFLGAPGLVGVDHDRRVLAHGLAQKIEPVEVALEIRVPDLDLEGAVADCVGMAEELAEGIVVEVEVETGRVGRHAVARCAKQAEQRQPHLLGREIPESDLDGLAKRQRRLALVAAAKPRDPMHQRERFLRREIGPDLLAKHPLDLDLVGKRREQRLGKAKSAFAGLVDQLEGGDVHLLCPHLAVADDAVAAELEAEDAKVVELHEGRWTTLISDISDQTH